MGSGDYLDDIATLIGCNDTYPQVIESDAVKTKDYAVELLSIEYAFTGNIEWEKHNNKYMRRKESTYDSQRTTKNIFRI